MKKWLHFIEISTGLSTGPTEEAAASAADEEKTISGDGVAEEEKGDVGAEEGKEDGVAEEGKEDEQNNDTLPPGWPLFQFIVQFSLIVWVG